MLRACGVDIMEAPQHSKRKEVPVDESTRAERAKRKRAERNKRYKSKGAAKVRHAEKERQRYHSALDNVVCSECIEPASGDSCKNNRRAEVYKKHQKQPYVKEREAERKKGRRYLKKSRKGVHDKFCDNCMRRNFTTDPRYALQFKTVWNTKIRANDLAKAKPKGKNTPDIAYSLCQECVRFLEKPDNYSVMTQGERNQMLDWKNTWPSFMWDLLSSPQNSEEDAKKRWRMICGSMRPYWVKAIAEIKKRGKCIYDGCDVDNPESFFEDRTKDVEKFRANIDCFDLKSMVAELDSEKPSLIPDVLCPWGCTEFCFQAKHFHLGIIIQHHLRKVVLKFPQSKLYEKLQLVESSRKDYIREDGEYDHVLMNPKWRVRPCVMMTENEGLMVMVCRHHEKYSCMKRLNVHPPRKPDNILSAEAPDQLCPCQIQPRTVQPLKVGKNNTSVGMRLQQISFSGADSFSILTDPQFSRLSRMLLNQESLSISMRQDINALLSQYVDEGVVSADLAENLRIHARNEYPAEKVSKYIQYATYVPLRDSMLFQIYNSSDMKVDVEIHREEDDSGEEDDSEREQHAEASGPVQKRLESSWLPTINFIQMEDISGYGYPLVPVGRYKSTKEVDASMMLWTLIGAIAGCKELYEAITKKALPFRSDGWEGHTLTHVCKKYARYYDMKCPSGSPFYAKKSETVQSMLKIINNFMPQDVKDYQGTVSESATKFFKFNIEYWKRLFTEDEHPSITIVENISEVSDEKSVGKTVIIVVDTDSDSVNPTMDRAKENEGLWKANDGSEYEARVVMGMYYVDDEHLKPGKFECVRWARHGNGFKEYWCQERNNKSNVIMTHAKGIRRRNNGTHFATIVVYVKIEAPLMDQYRLDFHRSLGGQMHVYCRCTEFPLITTGRWLKDKRTCMQVGCSRKEWLVCSNNECTTRICKKCFEGMSATRENILDPPCEGHQGVNESINSNEFSDSDEDSCDNNQDGDFGGDFMYENEYDDPNADIHDDDRVRGEIMGTTFLEDYRNSSEDYLNEDDENAEYDEDGDGHFDCGIRECVRRRMDGVSNTDMELGGYPLGDYLTGSRYDSGDRGLCTTVEEGSDGEDDDMGAPIPTTDAGDYPYSIYRRKKELRGVPSHVIMNQVGNLCNRYNHRIVGKNSEQNFIQRIVAKQDGTSHPLLYLMSTMFPSHFYAEATRDPCAVLGDVPICCYSRQSHPFGFCSQLERSRVLLTSSSSSTSTSPSLLGFVYDVLTNSAMSNVDSRLVDRHGFKVDVVSPHGISVREKDDTDLSESVDSHQAALDLAAAMPYVTFDLFLTFTCNQRFHPGVRHLHKYKESMEWTQFFPGYSRMNINEKIEVKRSYELAYGSVLTRVWYEVRRIFLKYLTCSKTSVFRGVKDSFWRDEYQDDSGNLCHIHGLVALSKEDLSDEEFLNFICDLQKCNLAEIFDTQNLQQYVDLGVFRSIHEYEDKLKIATEVLPHRCSPRCQMRVAHEGKASEQLKCRVPHPLKYRKDPLRHEFRPLGYTFSNDCLLILKEAGIYDPDHERCGQDLNYWLGGAYRQNGAPKGTFKDPMFCPTRHYGPCNPNSTENISPVNGVLFATTNSMQNLQVVRGTNGVARYIVKYLLKIDEGNRVSLNANAHSGSEMYADERFLHNTKIARSEINEKKALMNSRSRKHPSGRAIAFPDMLGRVLGHSDVLTSLKHIHIQTLSLEQRKTTHLHLTSTGALAVSDVNSTESDCQIVRREKQFPAERNFTRSQSLLYRHNTGSSVSYDMVTQFGLRPVEFLEVFNSLGNYFRWFHIKKVPMSKAVMREHLCVDMGKCSWIDCLGREVKLRRAAFSEVRKHLDSMVGVNGLHPHSRELIELVSHLVSNNVEEGQDMVFIHEDEDGRLPIPVYSSLTPRSPVGFLLHVMLVCGTFATELDLRSQPSMRESLVAANLIGDKTDDVSLRAYSIQLIKRVITDILPGQPISLRRMDEYIVTAKNLFDRVLLLNEIPITDMPPCLLTELETSKDNDIKEYWKTLKSDQLRSIRTTIPWSETMPSDESIVESTRVKPAKWPVSPDEAYVRSHGQNDTSYDEQSLVISTGVRTIDKYMIQLGPGASIYTKNIIVRGVPGAGKSFVTKYLHLYALSCGLRVIPTAVMGVRASSMAGEHMHKLFCLSTKKGGNVFRLAELAIDKLYQKSNLLNLHAVLTMDILLYDEFGQLSAEELKLLDIILRKVRKTSTSFGGVLIIANMDEAQHGPINGLPILLSSHILSEFVILNLTQSVRAHGDPKFCEIQNITRTSASLLKGNKKLEKEFKTLCRRELTFVESWDKVEADAIRMYARRKPAQEASEEYINACKRQFDNSGIQYIICYSIDSQGPIGSRAELLPARPDSAIVHYLNAKLREPRKLIFFVGAKFEATVNGDGFNQSQLLVMCEIPSQETVTRKLQIELLAAPSGVSYFDTRNGQIDKDDMIATGWKVVKIGIAPERNITSYGVMANRRQYSLRHVGAGTINKQTGNTIEGRCAIEMSKACSPWGKEQVVVMLSRTHSAKDTIIVGDREFAVGKMWDLITVGTEWSRYVEDLLNRVSIGGSQSTVRNGAVVTPEAYPFRISDMSLPDDDSGFVYFLVSVRDCGRTYIGQTTSISRRLKKHNSGWGAKGTAEPQYRPYAVAAYICGLSHMDKRGREGLEHKWKEHILEEKRRGMTDVYTWVLQGDRVVQSYNDYHPDKENHIRLVVTISRSSL